MKNYLEVKEELDKKTKKLREVEQSNTEFKLNYDEIYIENQLLKGSKKNFEKRIMEL